MTSSSKTDSYLLRRMNCQASSSGPFDNDIRWVAGARPWLRFGWCHL